MEYDALGQDFHSRGARLSEQIVLLRQLWEEPLVDFAGEFDRIERAGILPRPRRRIPIFCGGFSEPAYRRAAKLADGFIFARGFEDGAITGWRRLKELLAEEDRPIAGFGAHCLLQGTGGRTLSLDEIERKLPDWETEGGSEVSIVTMQQGFTSVDQHVDYMAEAKHFLGRLL